MYNDDSTGVVHPPRRSPRVAALVVPVVAVVNAAALTVPGGVAHPQASASAEASVAAGDDYDDYDDYEDDDNGSWVLLSCRCIVGATSTSGSVDPAVAPLPRSSWGGRAVRGGAGEPSPPAARGPHGVGLGGGHHRANPHEQRRHHAVPLPLPLPLLPLLLLQEDQQRAAFEGSDDGIAAAQGPA